MTDDTSVVSDTTHPSREQLMPWIVVAQGARLNQYVLDRLRPPVRGSFLRPDTEADPLHKMTKWCRGYLDAAVDHLVLWADYAIPLKFHPESEVTHSLRPALTLARAAMECAAQAIWILGPDEGAECGRRYIMLGLADLNEQQKAAETPEAKAEIRARRDECFQALGLTVRTFTAPTYLEMVRYVAEFLGDGRDEREPQSWDSPERVERLWRSAAGAAHGKQWPDWEFGTTFEEGGVKYWVPNVRAMAEVLEVAGRFVAAGVFLFAHRSGLEDEWPDLWQEATVRLATTLTPLDGVPIRAEDVPDLLTTHYDE